MNKFALDLARISTSDLDIPNPISIETQPNKLVRAVLAHLVAAKIGQPSRFDDLASTYCFNHIASIPEEISVFLWYYPYDSTVIFRDFAILDNNKPVFCQTLKYFPIAYLVTNKKQFRGLPKLNTYLSSEVDAITNI